MRPMDKLHVSAVGAASKPHQLDAGDNTYHNYSG